MLTLYYSASSVIDIIPEKTMDDIIERTLEWGGEKATVHGSIKFEKIFVSQINPELTYMENGDSQNDRQLNNWSSVYDKLTLKIFSFKII